MNHVAAFYWETDENVNENYLRIKSVIPILDDQFQYGRDYIVKPPEPLDSEKTYQYSHKKQDLIT